MRSIGMDIHAKQTYFHILDEAGRKLEQGKIATTETALTEVIHRHRDSGVQVAIEASTSTWWIQEVLQKAGARVEVTNPYKLKLIAESRSKTDKADAQILAELLRCGGLPTPVYVPSAAIRQLRQRLSLRRRLVRIRTQLICSAKAHLRGQGLKTTAQDFHRLQSWKALQEARSSCTWHLSRLVGTFEQIETSLRFIERELQQQWGQHADIKRLRTIPGVGPITAYTIVASLGEVRRFAASKQVAAYAGIVPSERSSGEVVVRGRITHEGRSELRGALIQAAWGSLRCRRDNALALKRFYYRLMHKRGSQIAIVALGHKLLTIAYQLLKAQTEFDETRLQKETKTECRVAVNQ